MRYIVGNWKMHGLKEDGSTLARSIADAPAVADTTVILCPAATLLTTLHTALHETPIQLGAQDCHWEEKGAHTGDISAAMLKDAGCDYVILGHSERRQHHGETSETVAKKAIAAHNVGLTTIICVGETLEERNNGHTQDVIQAQLTASLPHCATTENTVIAYEPVWAIGSGEIPEIAQISEVHAHITDCIATHLPDFGNAAVLYGGSVKPDNAHDIVHAPHVAGVLVGGASLDATAFSHIIQAAT